MEKLPFYFVFEEQKYHFNILVFDTAERLDNYYRGVIKAEFAHKRAASNQINGFFRERRDDLVGEFGFSLTHQSIDIVLHEVAHAALFIKQELDIRLRSRKQEHRFIDILENLFVQVVGSLQSRGYRI